SRGRSTVTERRERRTFVFGSSTPRDLSYMNKVPLTLRAYDSKPTKTPRLKEEETLAHYMRQARSLTPHLSDGRDGSCDRMRTSFAFGSSTPRQFSHLSAITPELRVYDVKIRPKVDKRSYTTPVISCARSKTVPATARISRTLPPKPQKAKLRSEDEEDEIASEPDFVQDREADFVLSIKKQWHAEQSAKNRSSKGNEASSVKRTTVREERHIIRTTTSEDGKTKKRMESVKQSSPKHISTVEDEVTDLSVEAAHPCIVPQSFNTAASDLVAETMPAVRPLNDSSEVVVIHSESTPEGRLGGFLGELAGKAAELTYAATNNQVEKASTKTATDDGCHATSEEDAKSELGGTEMRKNGQLEEESNTFKQKEVKLEVHASLSAPSDDRNDGREKSLEGEENKPVQLAISKKVPSSEGFELHMGISSQPISPESKAKLALVTESRVHSDFQYSLEQNPEDLPQSAEHSPNIAKSSPAHSEGAYSTHESTHTSEGTRQHYDSLQALDEGGLSVHEGSKRSSEEITRPMHESIYSADGTRSVHGKLHSTEGNHSLRKEINSSHPGAELIRANAGPTDDVRSSQEAAHSQREEILPLQHDLSPTKDIQSLGNDDRIPDGGTRSFHEGIHSTRQDIHPHHFNSHPEEDVHSSHSKEKRSTFTAEGLDSSSQAVSKRECSSDSEMDKKITSGSVEYSSTHSSSHSPGNHTELLQAERPSSRHLLESEYQSERRSPDQGSYFVQSSRFETGETRGSIDDSPADESRAYCITSGRKSSEEGTRTEDDGASLQGDEGENIEDEGEGVWII
uniref:FERM adjacent (FA) domain-containing protein n=2 Tax=Parascaris TaxID=6254 RepID=A0A915CC70_PARUN